MQQRIFVLAVPLLASALNVASAGTLCQTREIAPSATNWSSSIILQKHDPSVGALTGITITVTGTAAGSVSMESQDGLSTVISTTYQAVLSVLRPDNSLIVDASPTANFVDSLAAYDGVLDFGGASGTQHLGISLSATESISPLASDFALFTGAGTITLPVVGIATSSATGPGNLVVQFLTAAGATIEVCYEYAPDCNHNGIPDATDITSGTSQDVNNDGTPDECAPPPTGDEGCSHGYWKNHLSAWGPTGYSPGMSFNTVFGVTAFTPDRTLLQALQAGGGGMNNLGRQATAALLSAAHPGVDFPLDPNRVILLARDSVLRGTFSQMAKAFDDLVNLGCPLN